MALTYHQRRTSQGTKIGVRPYWLRYRRGKEKAGTCPFRRYCQHRTWGSTATHHKRNLYADHCSYCTDQEGVVRAGWRGVPLRSGIHVPYTEFNGWVRYARKKAREDARRVVDKKRKNDPSDLAFAKQMGVDPSPHENVDYEALEKALFKKNLTHLISELKADARFQYMRKRFNETHGERS